MSLRARLHFLRLKRGADRATILVRPPPRRPERVLASRVGLIAGLLVLVTFVFWLERDGLRDQVDGQVSLPDIVYFTAVTVSTVGYGDIVPVSPRARWIDALLVTPVRLFIWFIFLGTTYELLVQRVLEDWRMHKLQGRLDGHVVICGYGTVGRSAAAELVRQGRSPADIVVIDSSKLAADHAAALGHTTMHGSATREEILEVAGAKRAAAIVVCMDSDETTALVVLTARELSNARILVKINEQENRKLMLRSGANQVLTLGALGGSLMADGVGADLVAEFVADLVSRDGRVHLVQRAALPAEIGQVASAIDRLVMIRRHGQTPVCGKAMQQLIIEPGDQILCIGFT